MALVDSQKRFSFLHLISDMKWFSFVAFPSVYLYFILIKFEHLHTRKEQEQHNRWQILLFYGLLLVVFFCIVLLNLFNMLPPFASVRGVLFTSAFLSVYIFHGNFTRNQTKADRKRKGWNSKVNLTLFARFLT